MRPSLPALLFFSSVLACVALAGCAADTAAVPDDTALGDDELNTVNNKMGLRLTYDDPSGHVRATMKTKLHTGEKLVMRVRRGRLTNGAQTDLDCSQLAEAILLPKTTTAATASSTTTTTTTAKAIYVGPELDRSMLACVYNEQWINQNITADVLEQLSRDGADAIVDACIVREEAVRARLQTSLQYAWDVSDPHIDPALVHSH